ncbi:MAG TPA: MltA domain-containing protein, partial [Usitatibacter sp.]|nr:MltA domain-containing protein [Usitatibacter sp.]
MRQRLQPLSAIAAKACAAAAIAMLGACATPPAPKPEAAAVAPLVCPPAPQPVCPPPVPTPPPAPEVRGKLVAAPWSELPDWSREPLKPSLEAFVRSCTVLQKREGWQDACAEAQRLSGSAGEREIALFFETQFDVWQVLNGDDSATGLVTGYYEPLLTGSRNATERFRTPLYGVPDDLLIVDLGSLYPEL